MATIARTPPRLAWPALTWPQVTTGTLALGYLVLRLVSVSSATIALFPDSADYRGLSVRPIPRPPVYPLVIRLLGGNLAAVVALQWLVATVAWLVLALVVAHGLSRPWLRPVAVALVLAVGLSSPVAQWDAAILTESLALATGALLLAAALALGRQWRHWLAVALVALAALWLGLRDANAATLALVLALMLPALAWRHASWRVWLTVAVLFVLCVSSAVGANRAGRGVVPLDNVILARVLPDAGRTADYTAAGLPLSPALHAAQPGQVLDADPALTDYRAWRDARGQAVYLRDLATHPARTLTTPLAHAPVLLTLNLARYRPAGYAPALGGWLDRLVTPLALLGGVLALPALVRRRLPWLPLVLVISSLFALLLVFHADALEVTRHALLVNLQWRLGLLLAGLAAIDRARNGAQTSAARAYSPAPARSSVPRSDW